ncbi:MAG: hypothetical protein GF320_08550 [Armatimonadia bacterium]|nr:hypothetical protein [Armatimonadia bacterium]
MSAAQAQEQWEPAQWIGQALQTVLGPVEEAREDTNFGFMEGPSIAVALLHPGESAAMEIDLSAGGTYAFVAAGDEDAAQVSLTVYSEDGSVVDATTDALAALVVTPQGDGAFTVEVGLPGGEVGSYCALVMLEDGGAYVAPNYFGYAFGQLAAACTGIEESGLTVSSQVGSGFTLYGAVLAEGEDVLAQPVPLEAGQHVLIGAGDEDVSAMTCAILDEAGDMAATSEDGTPVPICDVVAESEGFYQAGIICDAADGPCAVMWGLFLLE